jgi:peptidoglycan/xylan/chitin deacetylase (PgdA/CDA1 family)
MFTTFKRVLAAIRRQLKAAVLDAIPSSRLIQRGPGSARRVALTFDDGPDHMTRAYLDLLEKLRAPSTFFLVGKQCEKEPALTREYVERGHQIASHGYDHTPFPNLGVGALGEQLRRTEASLEAQRTERNWVRPPYGKMDSRVLAQLLLQRKMVALWSLDPRDYETKDSDELVARCAPSHVSPGEVLLFHEGQQWTLDALPRIVGALRDEGYEMVTMADMFAA